MRLFFAIKLPDSIKTEVDEFIDQFLKLPGRVKWVEPKNLHLTLKFLGETDEILLSDLKAAAEQAAEGVGRFRIDLTGTGAFPNLRSPRVFWIGIKEEQKRLPSLHKRLDYNLAQLGFEPEKKKFSPHLTLARVKEQAGLEQLKEAYSKAEFKPVQFEVNEFYLIKSILKPTGPTYVDLENIPL